MRYVDGLREPTRIFEAAAWHYALRVRCECGNNAVFDPHALWWRFQRARWDDRFTKAIDRFYCRQCWERFCRKVRPGVLETCRDATTVLMPMPDEREWKRVLSRFRG